MANSIDMGNKINIFIICCEIFILNTIFLNEICCNELTIYINSFSRLVVQSLAALAEDFNTR